MILTVRLVTDIVNFQGNERCYMDGVYFQV
jgi:hypothetical protein